MIERLKNLATLEQLVERHSVVGIIGARQVGKTTLARQLIMKRGEPIVYFDLEDPQDMARLADPMLALQSLKGLVVIDEIQRHPDLFTVLRVLVDRPRSQSRFLILGSASPTLLRQSSESLAGRIVYFHLQGFTLDEVGQTNLNRLWLRGGFPRSYLATSHKTSHEWRQGFIQTFLERDLPQLGIAIRSNTLGRFWRMLAHYHGQTWNASEFGRSFGVADTTARNYLDIMTSALVINQLQPWNANVAKRQVKAPKIYIADTGLLHGLLNLPTMHDLEGHPKIGSSWEGFVMTQLLRRLNAHRDECFFWATHAGAELDLLVIRGRKRLGFEIKRTTSPRITPSIRIALADLKLQGLDIIHAGTETFPLAPKIRAVAISRLWEDIAPLK